MEHQKLITRMQCTCWTMVTVSQLRSQNLSVKIKESNLLYCGELYSISIYTISIEYALLVDYWFVYLHYSNNDTSQMNYEALGDTIDFQSDAITHCHEPTSDDATGNNDDAISITDDMLRINEKPLSFLSPVVQKLHQDFSNNSPSKLKMHTQNTIQASQKNMVDNIQYIIKNGNIENNEEVGTLWDQLETFIQDTKIKVQKETYVTPVKKNLSFPAFDSKKIKANSKI